METYIILGKLTQEGIRKIKQSPARVEAAHKALEAAGGKFISWHLTMGRFDFVAIFEAPDAKTAASILLMTGSQGDSQTETMRALSEAEYNEVVASLP